MRQPFATQIWSSFGMDTALFFECVLLYVYSKKPYAPSKEPRRQILHSFWVCIVLCILKKALHTIKRTQYTDSKSPIYIPKCHVCTLFECVQFYAYSKKPYTQSKEPYTQSKEPRRQTESALHMFQHARYETERDLNRKRLAVEIGCTCSICTPKSALYEI